MTQRVGRRALTAEVQVRSQATPDAIRGGRRDNLTGFHLSTSDILCRYDPPMLHTGMLFFYHRRYIILETESFDTETLLSLSHQTTRRHIPESISHTLIFPLTK